MHMRVQPMAPLCLAPSICKADTHLTHAGDQARSSRHEAPTRPQIDRNIDR